MAAGEFTPAHISMGYKILERRANDRSSAGCKMQSNMQAGCLPVLAEEPGWSSAARPGPLPYPSDNPIRVHICGINSRGGGGGAIVVTGLSCWVPVRSKVPGRIVPRHSRSRWRATVLPTFLPVYGKNSAANRLA